ncbi:MAG: ABC transporter ATP-binding protein [Candidatus Heimdallarchaeota archaeon]|nr:ABC transporter ATP-binding protein [Candidatus Heimdallarchaeota archaeon]
MAKLSMKKISMKYEKKLILENLELEVKHGELLVLLGESGCGKTTLLKIVAGIIQPEQGKIFVDNTEISNLSPQVRQIGYVPQAQVLFPHMKVKQNIAFGLEARKLTKETIEEKINWIADLVEISDLLDRYPRELSGGQKQRVALARAMAIEPHLLLLDEPLSSIDATGREALALTIRRIQKETSTTTLYVTHNGDEARLISDRVAVIYDGKIQQVGKVLDVEQQPRNYLISKILGSPNIWPILYTKKKEKTKLFTSICDIPFQGEISSKITGIKIPPSIISISKDRIEDPNLVVLKCYVKTVIEKSENEYRLILDLKDNPSEYIKVDCSRVEYEKNLTENNEINIYFSPLEVILL